MGFLNKKSCPLCGGGLSFFSLRIAGGEKICSCCEKLLRGRYDMQRQGAVFRDTLEELDPAKAKSIVDGMRAVQRGDIEKYGGMYAGISSVLSVFAVPASIGEEGKELAALGGKCVALCFCEAGSFSQGDPVSILADGSVRQTAILRLIPCTGAYPFEEELIEGSHKTLCPENSNAWLVLDLGPGAVDAGAKIVRQ